MTFLSSLSVFLFGCLTLVAPSGYSWGPALLLLLALVSYALPEKPGIPGKSYRSLSMVFILFFTVTFAGVLIHNLEFRALDRPSRFIFALMALPFLAKYPPKPVFAWVGIATGAFLGGLWAVKQVFWDGLSRAHGDTLAIQYGNIGMLFGLMSLAGLFWATQQKKGIAFKALMVLGVAGGITASLLSSSRGGWIALPIVLTIYLYTIRAYFTKRSLIAISLISCTAIASLALAPETSVHQRVNKAITEVNNYFETGKSTTSVGARLEMWKAAIILGMKRPLIGWGEIEVEKQKRRLVKKKGFDPEIQKYRHAHNDFLDSWQKRGGLGLFSLILLYVLPLITFIKITNTGSLNQKPLALAGTILCTCYVIFSLTQAFFEHNSGAMIYAFMLVIFWVMTTEASD
ncbi:O-antigen ligase family protein [Marinobacter sp.]|uniref:O-antigen ligase family protein n=1 Tax=Marinobacter sp. TaxID=50741 RepID=UPI003561C5BD